MKKIFFITLLSFSSISFFGQEIRNTNRPTYKAITPKAVQKGDVTEADYNKMKSSYLSDKKFMEYINSKANENVAGFVRMKELTELEYSEAVQKFGQKSVNKFVHAFQRSQERINIDTQLGDTAAE